MSIFYHQKPYLLTSKVPLCERLGALKVTSEKFSRETEIGECIQFSFDCMEPTILIGIESNAKILTLLEGARFYDTAESRVDSMPTLLPGIRLTIELLAKETVTKAEALFLVPKEIAP